MTLSPEQLKAYEDNFVFHEAFLDALRRTVSPLPFLRTLDYGAGAQPFYYSWFTGLHPNEEVTAFDPGLDVTRLRPISPGEKPTRWVSMVPPGRFDLVVCHFSIHHMDDSPRQVITQLRFMHPQLVAVAEYDYTTATEEEFRQTFVADQERNELYTMFRGDSLSCFKFHTHIGRARYQEALVENGYQIIEEGTGQGVAKYKFWLIGQSPSSVV